MVKVGDKLLDYNEDFKMYMVTRNSDIQLTPGEEGIVQVVNFTVTRSGLEAKLLSIIINQEKPDIE